MDIYSGWRSQIITSSGNTEENFCGYKECPFFSEVVYSPEVKEIMMSSGSQEV